MFDILVIGGGLSGTRAALECSVIHPRKRIALFEKRTRVLADLRPEDRFWFKSKQWTRTQLLRALKESPIEVYRSSGVDAIRKLDSGRGFEIQTRRSVYQAKHVILASGKEAGSLHLASKLDLDTRPLQIASFNLKSEDPRIKPIQVEGLQVALSWVKSGPPRKRIHIGLSSTLPEAQALKKTEGMISIRSGVVSGEAIRKMTSHIAERHQPIPEHVKICINWIPDYGFQGILDFLQVVASAEAGKTVLRTRLLELPTPLWSRLVAAADISQGDRWKDLKPVQFQELAIQLSDSQFVMKPDLRASTLAAYRGGVSPDDLHPDRPESKKLAGLYLLGSILDNGPITMGGMDIYAASQDLSWIQDIGKAD